jgi:hypothetical protein
MTNPIEKTNRPDGFAELVLFYEQGLPVIARIIANCCQKNLPILVALAGCPPDREENSIDYVRDFTAYAFQAGTLSTILKEAGKSSVGFSTQLNEKLPTIGQLPLSEHQLARFNLLREIKCGCIRNDFEKIVQELDTLWISRTKRPTGLARLFDLGIYYSHNFCCAAIFHWCEANNMLGDLATVVTEIKAEVVKRDVILTKKLRLPTRNNPKSRS